MSNWSSTQLTDLGRALDAKVTAGTTLLSFTKMKLGSGTETAEDIPDMTDLISPKLVLGISSCAVSASDDTICELISVASSDDVETSFVVRELGVYATDPDVGEILYAVMLDSTPDTMPNENVSSPITVTYQVNIVSANASSITAIIDPAGLVNVATLNAAIREHDTPVGTIIAYSGNGALPTHYLACDGSAVSRTTYAELFDVIGTTYGTGDGTTTFNLPDFSDGQFSEGSTTAGTAKAAGVPNITGQIISKTGSGAFLPGSSYASYESGSGYAQYYCSLDASRNSAVYGNSDTVQPKSLTMRYLIKYE